MAASVRTILICEKVAQLKQILLYFLPQIGPAFGYATLTTVLRGSSANATLTRSRRRIHVERILFAPNLPACRSFANSLDIVGKEADHHVRASATSGSKQLDLKRFGSRNPIELPEFFDDSDDSGVAMRHQGVDLDN